MNCKAIRFFDFWRNMTEYIISFLGKNHSVILVGADEKIEDAAIGAGIFIIPDSNSAFDVTARIVGGICYGESELLMLLGFFYKRLLGYPKCELSLSVDKEAKRLELFDTPTGYAGFCIKKCKLLCTSVYVAPDLTEHKLYTAFADGIYRIIHVKSPEGLQPEILSTLRTLKGLPTARDVVGLCDGRLVYPRSDNQAPYYAASAALTLSDENERESNTYDESDTYDESKRIKSVSNENERVITCDRNEYRVVINGDRATVLAPASLLKINKI